jgi:hypothetical protein
MKQSIQRNVFWMIDWLIIYGFTSLSRIFHLYGDVTIAGEGLPNLGLCSALRVFEQGGIFIVPHLLDLGFSGLIRRTAPFSCLLRNTRGCGGSILTRILTGMFWMCLWPRLKFFKRRSKVMVSNERIHMWNLKALPPINQKLWPRLKVSKKRSNAKVKDQRVKVKISNEKPWQKEYTYEIWKP